MATAVIMPRQGQSVESCVIGKWHRQKGDKVEIGDVLFTYETDKATFEEEAKIDGILLELFFEEGDNKAAFMICSTSDASSNSSVYCLALLRLIINSAKLFIIVF